jgi:two-component system chemotaxis response regulator CheB
MSAAVLRVLVVDDSSLMRRALADILAQDATLQLAGEAVDGLDALAKAEALRPDVILLDIEMPRMDGIAFLRAARLRLAARIIVISSVARLGSPYAMEALALGADDILPKPSGVVSADLAEKRGQALLAALRDGNGRRAP